MEKEHAIKLIEVRSPKGEVLCSLEIREMENGSPHESRKRIFKTGTNKGSNNSDKEDMMSYAQKKYLFRLLAEKGIEGDKAYETLKERFGVGGLGEITKAEASQAIERLLEELKGGNGNGSSK